MTLKYPEHKSEPTASINTCSIRFVLSLFIILYFYFEPILHT